MAVSTTSTGGVFNAITQDWANEFNLTSVDIQQYPPGFNGAVITLRRGKNAVSFQVAADLFDMDKLQGGLRAVKDMVYVQQKKLPQNRLDLRYNAIEDMNDFLTLVSREREKLSDIDTVILTPEQAFTLQNQAMKDRPDLMGQPILTIFGYSVETKGQD